MTVNARRLTEKKSLEAHTHTHAHYLTDMRAVVACCRWVWYLTPGLHFVSLFEAAQLLVCACRVERGLGWTVPEEAER